MHTEAFMYSEVLFICMLLIAIIFFKTWHHHDKRQSHKLYLAALICSLLMMLFDLIWGLMHYGVLPASDLLSTFVNQAYYFMIILLMYFWFAYTECAQNTNYLSNKKYRILTLLPVIFIAVLIFSSIFTGWVFYIDDLGIYHRGPLFGLHQICSFAYLSFSSLKLTIKALKKENFIHKKEYLILSSFIIFPLISAVLQIFFFGLPILCVGLSLGLLLVYTNYQELQISKDYLTGLSNRNQMISHLSSRINHRSPEKALYLLLIDANNFKSINDRFGHIVGDQALKHIANVLTYVCNQHNCFAARYGGDEFVVICELYTPEYLDTICNAIHANLKRVNMKYKLPYELTVSIGCAQYTDDIKYLQDLISMADHNLYKVKQKNKKAA